MSDFASARRHMVDGQVRTSDVTDLAVIDAMLAVPRENFVPAERRPMAYLDLEIEVSDVGQPARRIPTPMLVGRLLQAAAIRPGESVLVAGCATGYSVALAARLTPHVTGLEPDAQLADQCRKNLNGSSYESCTIVTGPIASGAAGGGPYDVILLDGATEIELPDLYRQLKAGGRLVGVFMSPHGRRAEIVTHTHNDFGRRCLFDASAPLLPGLEKRPAFVF